MKELVDNKYIIKDILCALILNSSFCKKYVTVFGDHKVFRDSGISVIEDWAVSYYRRYKRAIGSDISTYYENAVQDKKLVPEALSYIESVLGALTEYSDGVEFNEEFLIDSAIELKNRADLEDISKRIDIAIKTGDVSKAKDIVKNFKAVENKNVEYLDIANNVEDVVETAFAEDEKNIIAMPGELGEAVNSLFTPASMIIVRGSAKSGKSFFGNYIKTVALLQKRKVLDLALGDLTKKQIMMRQLTLLSKRSIKPIGKNMYPVLDCMKSQSGECYHVDKLSTERIYNADGTYNDKYIPCSICRGKRPFPFTSCLVKDTKTKLLDKENATLYLNRLKEHMGDEGGLRILEYPAKTYSPLDLERTMRGFSEEENSWIPDIVIIDYEALMKSTLPNGTPEHEVVADRFVILNRIRKEFNCCLVVLDQTRGRGVFEKDDQLGVMVQSSESYSGGVDKERYATAVININRDDIGSSTKVVTTSCCRDGGGIDTFVVLFQNLLVSDIAMDSFQPDEASIRIRNEYIKANEKGNKK